MIKSKETRSSILAEKGHFEISKNKNPLKITHYSYSICNRYYIFFIFCYAMIKLPKQNPKFPTSNLKITKNSNTKINKLE